MIVEVEFDTSDIEATLAAADVALSDGLALSVDNTCKSVADDARDRHKFQNRTHNLEDSIGGQLLYNTGLESVGTVYAIEPYASFVEEGTSRSRALPFLQPALDRGERELERQVNWAYRECQAVLNR